MKTVVFYEGESEEVSEFLAAKLSDGFSVLEMQIYYNPTMGNKGRVNTAVYMVKEQA